MSSSEISDVANRSAARIIATFLKPGSSEQFKSTATFVVPPAVPCANVDLREHLKSRIGALLEQIGDKVTDFRDQQRHFEMPMRFEEAHTREEVAAYNSEQEKGKRALEADMTKYSQSVNADVLSIVTAMSNVLKIAPPMPIPTYDGGSVADAKKYLNQLLQALACPTQDR